VTDSFVARFADVCSDAAGNVTVAWSDNTSVFGRRFDSAGGSLGTEFAFGSAPSSFLPPSVGCAPGGEFVVVWTDFYADSDDYSGVLGQRFDSAANPVGDAFHVNSYTVGGQQMPDVAVDADGHFVVVWDSWYQDGSYVGVFGQQFASDATPIGSEFQVNTATAYYQRQGAVAFTGDGQFAVVWEEHMSYSAHGQIFARAFDSDGSPVEDGFGISDLDFDSGNADVAGMGAGEFVVVWESNNYYTTGPDGSYMGVFGGRFDAAGELVGSEFQVSVYTYGYQETPAIAPAGSGYIVVWSSDPQDGDSNGVFGRRFDASDHGGDEFQVNLSTPGRQWRPAVACDANADCVAVWRSEFGAPVVGTFGRALPRPLE
jgi:hypothetical protein